MPTLIDIIPGVGPRPEQPNFTVRFLPFAITLTGDPYRDLAHLVTLGIDKKDENGRLIARDDFERLYADLLREAIMQGR